MATSPKPRALLDVRPFPRRRKIVNGALRGGKRRAPVHALVEVDVTNARNSLAKMPARPSLTAFVVVCVARTVTDNPEVHAYRDWRGRLVIHRGVDIATMVETDTPEGPVPFAHVVRGAERRSVEDVGSEIRLVKSDPTESRTGSLLVRMGPTLARVPFAMRTFYWLLDRSIWLRSMSGTVSVTSVGMFGTGGGFGIGFPTLMTLGVLVGGVSKKARVIDDKIEIREVLDLTVTADHKIVDGAPLARFVADLRALMESGSVLD